MTTMKHTKRAMRSLAIGLVLIGLGACDLELQNPNSPTETEVLSSLDGVVALAVGMQDQYASGIEDFVLTGALITDEWATTSRALLSYRSLIDGLDFQNNWGVVSAPWSISYSVMRSANTLLALENNTDLGLDPALKVGVIALAKLFKGMALGQLALQYDRAAIDISVEFPAPNTRAEVLAAALVLLEDARTDLTGVADADLAGFRSRILGSRFDLRNTIDAMLARYHLVAGNYAEASTAAGRVDLGVLSEFTYKGTDRNPIENLAFQALYVAALESFVNDAEAPDNRPAYWVDVGAATFTGNPDSVMLPLRKYSAQGDPYPAYLPDEMKLIQAEAAARAGQFTTAAALVNEVRTQVASAVDEPLAGLAAMPATALDTEAELLAQIAYERRYELYMQGLRWDDTRRLGTAITTVPTMTFLPTPARECDTNNTFGC